MTYYQIEQRCVNVFLKKGPFRHLCTPGKLTEIICENEDDYRFCVSMIAIAAVVANVRIITFEIMSNHIHVVLSGEDDDCNRFFDYFKDKLKRYFTKTGRYKNLDGFEPALIPIDSLESLRNEIVYTCRNGYVATGAYTPFSYPWGGGNLFFNTFAEKVPARKYKTLTYREKRTVCHGTGLELPDNYEVDDNGIVTIAGATMAQVEDAHAMVMSIIRDLTVGDIYYGTVTRIMSFGAFVECLPGKEGMLHVSEISANRVPHTEDVFKVGDRVLVMVKEVEDTGRVNLTRRRVMANEEKVRESGFAYALPDERERENLISSLTSKDRGRGFSMKDRINAKEAKAKIGSYMDRGYSSNRTSRNDFENARERRGRGDRRGR